MDGSLPTNGLGGATITGTPANVDVGVYPNITIKVNDGSGAPDAEAVLASFTVTGASCDAVGHVIDLSQDRLSPRFVLLVPPTRTRTRKRGS